MLYVYSSMFRSILLMVPLPGLVFRRPHPGTLTRPPGARKTRLGAYWVIRNIGYT